MEHIDSNTIWLYATGKCTPNQIFEIHQHIANCKQCETEIELIKEIETTLNVIGDDQISTGFSDKVITKIEGNFVLNKKAAFFDKFFKHTILSGFVLAIISALIISYPLEIDLPQINDIINNQVALAVITSTLVLWGIYFIDRGCKRFYSPF